MNATTEQRLIERWRRIEEEVQDEIDLLGEEEAEDAEERLMAMKGDW